MTALIYDALAEMIPEGLVWQYQITLRDKRRANHIWLLKGPRGGIHVHAFWATLPGWPSEWSGGIEAHSPIPDPEYPQPASQEHCWVIGTPCWHDGSSLEFSEQIAPYLPYEGGSMDEGHHITVLQVMLSRYNIWLPALKAVKAASK